MFFFAFVFISTWVFLIRWVTIHFLLSLYICVCVFVCYAHMLRLLFQSEHREWFSCACAWWETLHPKKMKSNICISIEPVLSSFEKEMGSEIIVFAAHTVCFQRSDSFFLAAARVCCVKKDEKDAFRIKIRICVCCMRHNSKDILRAYTHANRVDL